MAELTFFGLPAGQGEPAEQAAHSMQQRLAQLLLAQPQEGQQAGQQEEAAAAAGAAAAAAARAFDSSREYLYQEALYGLEGRPAGAEHPAEPAAGQHPADHQHQQQLDGEQQGEDAVAGVHHGPQWVYLRFSQPVTAAADSLVIGSRLDADLHASTCRLAFYGRLCALADPSGELGGSVGG